MTTIPSPEPKSMTLPNGAAVHLVSSDGHQATIESPEPAPPGSVVRARIEGVAAEFQLKVRNCRKQGETFLIDGRTQNATREVKAWLSDAP